MTDPIQAVAAPAASRLLLRANLRALQQAGSLNPAGVAAVAGAFGRPASLRQIRINDDERAALLNRILPPRNAFCVPQPPVILLGWHTSLLSDLIEQFRVIEGPSNFRHRLLIAEPNPAEIASALGSIDLIEQGIEPSRLIIFTGINWLAELQDWLATRLEQVIPSVLADLGVGRPATAQVQDLLAGLRSEQAGRLKALAANNHDADSTNDHSVPLTSTAARAVLREAAAGKRSLSVLICGSRYTTYVRHALEGLSLALESMGHQPHFLLEPDASTVLTPLAYRRAVEITKPDLIVIANYPRCMFKNAIPASIPFVCWIQDAMPHLFNREVGASVNEAEFFIGNAMPELAESFDYPAHAMVPWCVPACHHRFHSGRIDPELQLALECDVAFVSHHSESVDAMCQRLIAGCSKTMNMADLVMPLQRAMQSLIDRAATVSTRASIDQLIHDTATRELGWAISEEDAALARHTIAIPLLGRMFRHETLRWAAAICDRRGWNLRIFGNGWEQSAEFARFASGPIEHGERLRACYQAARVHLHIDPTTLTHQRIFECAMSGGLPIARFHRDGLYSQEAVAADEARDLNARDWSDCPLGARYLQACSEQNITPPPMREVIAATAPFGQEARETTAVAFDAHWLYGGFQGVTFTDAASLETTLERAIHDHNWRDDRSALMRQRMIEAVSMQAFAQHMLSKAAAIVGLRPTPARAAKGAIP